MHVQAGAAAAPAPAEGAAAGNSCRAKFGTGGSDDLYAHCVTLTQDAADVRLKWRLDTLAGMFYIFLFPKTPTQVKKMI